MTLHGETAGQLQHVLPRHCRRKHEFKNASRQILKALSIIKHQLGPFCQALPLEYAPIIRNISIQIQKIQLNQLVKLSRKLNAFSAPFSTLPNSAECSKLEFDNAFDYDSDVIVSETLQAGFGLKKSRRCGETGQ